MKPMWKHNTPVVVVCGLIGIIWSSFRSWDLLQGRQWLICPQVKKTVRIVLTNPHGDFLPFPSPGMAKGGKEWLKFKKSWIILPLEWNKQRAILCTCTTAQWEKQHDKASRAVLHLKFWKALKKSFSPVCFIPGILLSKKNHFVNHSLATGWVFWNLYY